MIPVALLDDRRLDGTDLRAYVILLAIDVDRDGVACISLPQLGRRIFRSERTTERSIRKLERTGWIQSIDNGIGRCKSYRLLTPGVHVGGGASETVVTGDGGETQSTAIRVDDPLTSMTKTPVTDGQQPISYLKFFTRRPQKRRRAE